MKKLLKKTVLFFLVLLLGAQFFAAPKKNTKNDSENQEKEKTVITILNALKTSNIKDKEKDEDLILFEGSVKIEVAKGKTKTVISADMISWSRKHEMLYAEGNVSLEQSEENGSVSNITATSVLFNTSSLEGIFDEGRVLQADTNSLNLPSGSTLVVGSDVFARNHSGTVAFKSGELTFCNAEHPHWKIKATRIWLLPGNEFAFFNAVLFMDNIPVMYLPAFYYPKDELIFNPVFGYKNRNGFYMQTTTYLYGRKPLETAASSSASSSDNDASKYFNFIKPTKLMDQELQGIVLHNLDTAYTGNTTDYLKVMADWYANLGCATGIEGVYKPKKIFSTLEGSLMLGFSNTVFPTASSSVYLPFGSSGTYYYEKSNFMGAEIPFRYKAGIKVGISTPLSLTLTMPLYSDPYFNYDFGDRSETMDWFSYLLNNPLSENTKTTEQQKLEAAEITSFTWDLSGNYSVKLPDSVKPYIDTISFSSFNSSIAFGSKAVDTTKDYLNKTDNYHLYTSQRKFFYPQQVTPFKGSLKISGTIFSIGEDFKTKKSVDYPVPLIAPDKLGLEFAADGSSDSAEKNDAASGAENSTTGSSDNSQNKGFIFERDGLADIDYTPESTATVGKDFTFNLKYSISPDFASQMNYSPEGLNVGTDFRWDRIQSSYISLKVPLMLSDSLSLKNDFFTMQNSISFNPVYQIHPYISNDTAHGGKPDSEIKSMKKSDYIASTMELLNTNTLSLKPFIYYPHFKDTGISYNTAIKFFRTKFIGDADNPEWDKLTVNFDDPDSITNHTLALTLAANELGGDFKQSLVLTSTLPPQTAKYYATLQFVFPFVTLTGEAGVKQKSATDKTWESEQLKQALTVSLFDKKLNFTQSYNYDVQGSYSDSLKLALTYEGLQLAYTMKYSTIYDFDSDRGWVAKNEKQFVPYSASIAYATPSKTFYFWKNRIKIAPSLSTSLVVDFVKPTNSYFIFSPGITFKINEFIDITFSATSRNDVLYRYVQSALGTPGRIPGEDNIFVDLINSFRFDDENLRRGSGFKLKSLNFTITHDLHDWDLKCDFKIEPRLVTPTTGSKYYDFSPYFSISVVWRPMESMKTEILDEYGTWKLK